MYDPSTGAGGMSCTKDPMEAPRDATQVVNQPPITDTLKRGPEEVLPINGVVRAQMGGGAQLRASGSVTKLNPASAVVAAERIHQLNDHPPNGGGAYVLYWVQSAVRTRYNHALEFACERANHHNVPLLPCFGVTEGVFMVNS